MIYPVKIEFKEYPSGSWADWSQYLSEPPDIHEQVESENEGEAGVIVFDSADVTFRYDNGTPVYSAFSGDLSAKQRYLFRISAPKSDKTYVQLYEGMADFSTIHWPDPDEGKLIAFSVIDKLSALGIIPADSLRGGQHNLLYDRNTDTDVDNIDVFTEAAITPAHHKWFGIKYRDAALQKPTTYANTPFLGEVVQSPYDATSLAIIKYKGKNVDWQDPTDWMIFDVINYDTTYPLTSGNSKNVNNIFYYINAIYGTDLLITQYRDDYEVYFTDQGTPMSYLLDPGYEVIAYDGMKLIEALVKFQWPEITLVKKPSNLEFNIPLNYYLRLISDTPFDTDPLGALKILADTLKCYIYINRTGNLVVQSKETLSTNGTTRTIGTTKIISKPERRYFWDKLVDGVTVEIKSWMTDENGDYLVGASIQTKQIPGSDAFIKPKNELTKELLSPDASEITQEDLDARAATEALNILNFYGKRRSDFDLELNLDDNTLEWELIDNLTIDSMQCFFISLDFDLALRTLTLTPVEIASHDYDFRQIVVGLSEANSIGGGIGGSNTYNIVTGGGSGSYLFSSPLSESGGTVSLLKTGNFKITGSSLDTIQDILTSSTPTFNQLNLSTAGTSGQAVRADRSVLTSVPLTGGGDLTANRTIQLNYADPLTVISNNLALKYNATNLKLTATELNTIQNIDLTATPQFAGIRLDGANNNAYATPPTAIINGAYISIGDYSGGRTFANGMGIKFHDTDIAHASIHYLPSTQKINFGKSSSVSHLQIDTGFEALTIDLANKRLGINKTAPAATLDVTGDEILSGIITVNGTGNSYIAGRLGLGVSPQATTKLQVDGNIFVSGGDRIILNYSNNYLAFGTNNTERMRILAGGNIGINVLSPATTLEVGGNVHVSGGDRTFFNRSNNYLAFGTNNTESFRIKNDGNVGFGITNPVEKINLSGHFRQDGSWSLYNNFTSGWTGSGWRVDYNITSPSESTIEADNMFLRGTLSVYELLIQQIRATNGSIYVTACGKIETVTGTPPNETVTIEDPTGNSLTPFAVDDILIVQEVDLNSINIIKRIVRRVVNISSAEGVTYVTLGSIIGGPADTGILEIGDDLIRIGNLTNAARQGSLYLTSDDSNAPFMDVIDNVDSWAAWKNPAKLKARLGKLTGITDPVFGSLSDYGLYTTRLYLSSKSTTNGIALYADDATSKLTMYQGGNVVFDFDTASATAKIASWTITNTLLKNDTYKIYMGTSLLSLLTEGSIGIGHRNTTGGAQTYKGFMLIGNPTTNYISLLNNTDGAYTQGYVYQDISGKTSGLNEIKVSLGDLRGIADTGFGMVMKEGSTEHFRFTELNKHIAGWNFSDANIWKLESGLPGASPEGGVVISSSGKAVIVYGDYWQRFVRMAYVSPTDWGLKGTNSANQVVFQLGYTNNIAGWVFDTVKFTKGTATAGFSLNTSSTPFITGINSKGFEIYDTTNIKMFAGLRDGSGNLLKGLDWNITTANELTVRGNILASTITGGILQTATSGLRVVINESNNNAIKFYTSTGNSIVMSAIDFGGAISSVDIQDAGIRSSSGNRAGRFSYLSAKLTDSGDGSECTMYSNYMLIQKTGNSTQCEINSDGYITINTKNVGKYYGELGAAPTVGIRGGDTYFNSNNFALYFRANNTWIQIN